MNGNELPCNRETHSRPQKGIRDGGAHPRLPRGYKFENWRASKNDTVPRSETACRNPSKRSNCPVIWVLPDFGPGPHLNHQSLSAFIWSVADMLRGDYKQSDYSKGIAVLQELRSALVPIAVTGNIDVRGLSTGLDNAA